MPSPKATLSAALAKASTAVQLDNAQYHSGARKYYQEACELIEQVIDQASNEASREKLRKIRVGYINRIQQLNEVVPSETESSRT